MPARKSQVTGLPWTYGLATGKIRSPLVKFEHHLSDIQTLNQAAREGRYEMTAISYHAYLVV